MSPVEAQRELPLLRKADITSVSIEVVRAQKNAAAAFTLACSISGLEDKEIYLALEIDAGYFSNIKKGKATLQADLIAKFCEIVGNSVYPEWLAFQLGCTLVMVKTEAERRADAEKARADRLESENALMRQLLSGRAVA